MNVYKLFQRQNNNKSMKKFKFYFLNSQLSDFLNILKHLRIKGSKNIFSTSSKLKLFFFCVFEKISIQSMKL